MSVQRFNHVCEIYAGKPMSLHSEGDWVGYTVLAEREQRIAKLEHVCRVAISMCELCEDGRVRRYYTNAGGYDMVPCPCCGKARAALAATEGEKR